MDVAVPVAFETVASQPVDLPSAVRLAMRDEFSRRKLITQVVKDIKSVLSDDGDDHVDWDVVELWDGGHSTVPSGVQWGNMADEDFVW